MLLLLLTMSAGTGLPQAAADVIFEPAPRPVQLDFVVRDAKGKFVRDLRAGEITITDDGRAVNVRSIFLNQPKTPVPGDPQRYITLLFGHPRMLVFDEAQSVVRRLLKNTSKNVLISVLFFDHKLHLVQPFTRDSRRLLEAVRKIHSREERPQPWDDTSSPSLTDSPGSRALADALAATARGVSANEIAGALATAEARLPGRKQIVYLSGQNPLVDSNMEETISAANRGGVSFYLLDLPAMSVIRYAEQGGGEPAQQQAAAMIHDAVQRRHEGLATIALNTGGFHAFEPGSIGRSVLRIAEEAENYYVATYYAHPAPPDGHLRTTSVKIARPGVTLYMRTGYRSSLPAPPPSRLADALRAAIAGSERSSATSWRLAVHGYFPAPDVVASTVTIELPLASAAGGALSALAVFRDESGRIAAEWSRDIEVPLPAVAAAGAKVLLLEAVQVTPGRYSVQAAVASRTGVSVESTRFDACAPAPCGFGEALIIRAFRHASEWVPRAFLRYQGMQLVPDYNTAVTAGEPFYFYTVAHPCPVANSPLTVEITSGEQVLATVSLPPPPDEAVPYGYLASMDPGSLPPGSYQLRIRRLCARAAVSSKLTLTGTVSNAGTEAPQARLVGQPPRPEEQLRLLEAARAYWLHYDTVLPSFSCLLSTERFIDPTSAGAWKKLDSLEENLRYQNGGEQYSVSQKRGAERPGRAARRGIVSRGEFGSLLADIFSLSSKTEFEWREWTVAEGKLVHIFHYSVPRERSRYVLSHRGRPPKEWIVGYGGTILIDGTDGKVARLTLNTDNMTLPPAFPVLGSSLEIAYRDLLMGGVRYLLPVAANLEARRAPNVRTRNVMRFRNYRQYTADSTIDFGPAQ